MRKTVILVLVAIALGAYVYFYEIKGGEKRDKEKEVAEKLFQLEKDSVNYLAIKSFKDDFVFTKTEDGWEIEKPLQTGADESPINSLLSSLANSKKTRTFNIKSNENNQYGLGSRASRVIFKTRDGKTDSILIGDKTNIGSNVYVSNVDTVIHLVPQSLKTNADKTLFDWRDKKPIHFKKDEIREFNLYNTYGKFAFVKEGTDWKITKPIETVAEKSTVDAVLNKLDYSKIMSVVSEGGENLSKFDLAKPTYTIELFSGTEKAKTSVILSKDKNNVSHGKDSARPFVYTVDSTFIQPFKKDLFGFRDKKIIDFETSKTTRINLSHNNEVMTFTKDTSDTWYLDSGEKAKNWKINGLLSSVNNLKAEKFVEENPTYFMNYGLVNPESRIEIFEETGLLAELNLGFVKNEFVYVYNPSRKPIVSIKEEKLKDLFPPKDDLLEEVKKAEEITEE